jgi:hypothetical protein
MKRIYFNATTTNGDRYRPPKTACAPSPESVLKRPKSSVSRRAIRLVSATHAWHSHRPTPSDYDHGNSRVPTTHKPGVESPVSPPCRRFSSTRLIPRDMLIDTEFACVPRGINPMRQARNTNQSRRMKDESVLYIGRFSKIL